MGTGEWTLMHLLVYFHDFDFRTPYSSVLLVSLCKLHYPYTPVPLAHTQL